MIRLGLREDQSLRKRLDDTVAELWAAVDEANRQYEETKEVTRGRHPD